MVPTDLKSFFAASAGVAGALIGLLFVAITVAQERLTAEGAAQAHRVRASAALTAFINALTVSLFALLPGQQIGGTTLTMGLLGLLFIAGSLISLVRVRRSQPGQLREALFLVGFAVTFALEVLVAARVIANPRDTSSVHAIAVLVVVCFLIGIARSWELVGGPSIGLRGEIPRSPARAAAKAANEKTALRLPSLSKRQPRGGALKCESQFTTLCEPRFTDLQARRGHGHDRDHPPGGEHRPRP